MALSSPRTFLATGWNIFTAPLYRKTSVAICVTYALFSALILGFPTYLPLPIGVFFTFVYMVITLTLPLYITIVTVLILMTMLQGKPIAPFTSYMTQAQARFGKTLWVSILTALATVLGIFLLVVPGIIVAIRLSFASLLAMIDPTITYPMKTSWNMTKGRFFAIFFRYIIFSAIGFIPVLILRTIHPMLGYVGYMIYPYTLLLTLMLTYELRKS